MSFEPQNFDGEAAGARMLAMGTNIYHECLGTVAQAIKGDVSSDNPGYYTTAIRGWAATPPDRRHSAAGDMPPGRVFYAATSNIPDGHVAITAGGRKLITTDWPARHIGVATVEELVDAWDITPLGWTDWFLGHNLTTHHEDPALQRRRKENIMYTQSTDKNTPTVYAVFTDANGAQRLRPCGAAEAAIAIFGGLVTQANPQTIQMLGQESGWVGGKNTPLPLPKVAGVTASTLTSIRAAITTLTNAVKGKK